MIVGISSTYFTYNSSKEKFEIKDIRIQYLRIVGCDGQSLSRYDIEIFIIACYFFLNNLYM